MRRSRSILVYVGSEAVDPLALEQAVRVCRSWGDGSRLHVVAALPDAPWPVRLLQGQGPDPAALVAALRARLADLVAPLAREGLRVSTDVLRGTPFLALIGQVLAGRFELLVKHAEGRAGAPFGSTALHLIRKCPCPVWVVASSPAPAPARVLAAIDPDPFDPVRARLAEAVLRAAGQLAELDGGELHVAYAWTAWGQNGLRGGPSPDRLESYRVALAAAARAQLDGFLGRVLPELPLDRVHLLSDEPGAAVAECARALAAHTLVIGTVGRVGAAHLLIGSTAERALSLLGCSVMALKPQGFASPVSAHSAME